MFLRILLISFYILVPFILVFIITSILNLSQRNQTSINYILDTGSLINPENIYYTKPEDILYKNKYYLSNEVIDLMYYNGYLDDVTLIYDFKNQCKLDFEFDKQQVDYMSFSEFRLSFLADYASENQILEAKKCIDDFVSMLNNLLFKRYNLDDILERIDYNINVLQFVMDTRQNQFLKDTEIYYFETRANVIINSLLIIENLINETTDKLNKLDENSIILNDFLKKLLKQKSILNSFNQDTNFSSQFNQIDPSKYLDNEKLEPINNGIYYRFLINKLKLIKQEIEDDTSILIVKEIKTSKQLARTYSIISPGFVIFIVMISALVIILFETFYRRFRY